MSDPLKDQWESYAGLIAFKTVAERIKFPKSCLPEVVRFLLPSVSLAKDGPVVEALCLVTENYLCEVRLNQNSNDFDVAPLATIRNYRVEIGKQEITREEPASEKDPATEKRVTKITYDTASIELIHSFPMTTRLTYVGEGRDAWIHHAFTSLPIDVLFKSRGE